MTRRATPLSPVDGPLAQFVLELRGLRDAMGSAAPSVDAISKREQIPRSTLFASLKGDRLPSREVVAALARSWGADEAEWLAKRSAVEASLDAPTQGLTSQLTHLHQMVGAPSYGQLSAISDRSQFRLSKTTISDLLRGRGTPRWATVEAFVNACRGYARAHRLAVSGDAFDLARWRDVHERTRHGQENLTYGRATAGVRTIEGWDPYVLGVHRARDASATTESARSPLPRYIRRAHDNELETILRSDSLKPTLVVLVGEASSGKTRAAYEAVHRNADMSQRPLLYPDGPEDLLEVIQTGQLQPPAILWLDETQRYLTGPNGEQAAAALRWLLTGSARGPITAVGTMWPQYWNELATIPVTGENNFHAQAKNLLSDQAHKIIIPNRFTAQQLEMLTANHATDSRLIAAINNARPSGHVIQALTLDTGLVADFEHPATAEQRYAAAIITVAIDARRLGHSSALPEQVLRQATPAYLSPAIRETAALNWLDAGLAYATTPVRGVAALVPVKSGHSARDTRAFLLNDYLYKHGRTHRRLAVIPLELWDALVTHAADADDLFRLAESAHTRRLHYSYAEHLYRRAQSAGHRQATARLAQLLDEQSRHDEAIALYFDLFRVGHTEFRVPLAQLLIEQNRVEEAERIWREAAGTGDVVAVRELGRLLADRGRVEEAERIWREALATGDEEVRELLAHLLVEHGQFTEAERIWREAAGTGDVVAVRELGRLLADRGRVEEAERIWREALATGDEEVRELLAHLLVEHGRSPEPVRHRRGLGPVLSQAADVDDQNAAFTNRTVRDGLSSATSWAEFTSDQIYELVNSSLPHLPIDEWSHLSSALEGMCRRYSSVLDGLSAAWQGSAADAAMISLTSWLVLLKRQAGQWQHVLSVLEEFEHSLSATAASVPFPTRSGRGRPRSQMTEGDVAEQDDHDANARHIMSTHDAHCRNLAAALQTTGGESMSSVPLKRKSTAAIEGFNVDVDVLDRASEDLNTIAASVLRISEEATLARVAQQPAMQISKDRGHLAELFDRKADELANEITDVATAILASARKLSDTSCDYRALDTSTHEVAEQQPPVHRVARDQ